MAPRGQAQLRRWSMVGATGPQTNFTTLKMKPHRVRKAFQVAAGQIIKIITKFVINHMH